MSLLSRIAQLDLFGTDGGGSRAQKKSRPNYAAGWELVDHACRNCLGRVLVRRDHKGEPVETRCAECGTRAAGGYLEICCCGADCGALGRVLECFPNPEVTPAVPQEVLVRERPIEATDIERRTARPVSVKGY